MLVNELLAVLNTEPEKIEFDEVMSCIDESYHYSATTFTNGMGEWKQTNEAGSNEGSCKIFYFAQLHDLSVEQTLACFGRYYRDDVVKNPHGTDHTNIRNFIMYGWPGVSFDGVALTLKAGE